MASNARGTKSLQHEKYNAAFDYIFLKETHSLRKIEVEIAIIQQIRQLKLSAPLRRGARRKW